MATGTEILRKVERASTKAKAALTKAETELSATQAEDVQIQSRLSALGLQLAQHQANLPDVRGASPELGAANRRLRVSLQARETSLAALHQKLDHLVSTRKGVRAEIASAQSVFDTAKAKAIQLRSEFNAALEASPAFPPVKAEGLAAEQAFNSLSARSAQALAEREQKSDAYQRDLLFSYLLTIGYGTPRYKRGPLHVALDGFVARTIGFATAYRNYQLLQQLPEFVATHLNNARTHLDEAKAKARAIAAAMPEHARLEAAMAEARDAEADLGAKQEELEELQKRIDQAGDHISMFADFKDPAGQKILGELKEVYEDTEITALADYAMKTPSPDDDRIVAEIDALRRSRTKLAGRIFAQTKDVADLREAARRASDLHYEFRKSGRANSNYTYRDSAADDFVAGVLIGSMSSSSASRGLESSGTRVPDEDSWSSSSSSSSSSQGSGGFGGGGFSSGGSFGGGGFSTGGGF